MSARSPVVSRFDESGEDDKFPSLRRPGNVQTTWEIINDFSGGLGILQELNGSEHTPGYSFAGGAGCSGATTLGATLFSARRGVLLPPVAETAAGALGTFTRFIEFSGAWYAVTSATPGVVYKWDADGDTPSVVETLTGACTQLFQDGTTLYASQGAAGACRITTDGATWTNAAYNSHCHAVRDEAIVVYMTGATLTPGDGYVDTVPIGYASTVATAIAYLGGGLFIGKPEGLYLFKQGRVSCVFPVYDQLATTNFRHMVVHRGYLYFNVGSMIFYTNGSGHFAPVYPEHTSGFENVDGLFPTLGPLLISARLRDTALTLKSFLMLFDGPDHFGLNPLWSDVDGSKPIVGCGATNVYDTTKARVYLSQTGIGEKWLNLTLAYEPGAYHTNTAIGSWADLVPHTAATRVKNKIFTEVVVRVRNPNTTTFAQIWYSLDGGTLTQTLSAAAGGSAHTLTLSAGTVKTYLPSTVIGIGLKVRIYLWTTTTAPAGITHVNLVAKRHS